VLVGLSHCFFFLILNPMGLPGTADDKYQALTSSALVSGCHDVPVPSTVSLSRLG